MSTFAQLNLARKWRARNFDELVGQDVTVRILKNSLYLNQFFPVYLFAGQRGCGKTSAARILAAAVNCYKLEQFQSGPQGVTVPCGSCDSCLEFFAGRHPDFIEIDAASHTGVDNVRLLIESATYLPLLGKKKVYLIDEAHMLSKAAFNAFLKVLEEPPMSVIFILATTDVHKIIDTVASRCFHLIFNPINHTALRNHLSFICKNESIRCDDDAMDLIVRESSGSARDAINLLEQLRFAEPVITVETFTRVLGRIADHDLFSLLDVIINGDSVDSVIKKVSDIYLENYNPEYVWKRFLELVKHQIWDFSDEKKIVSYLAVVNIFIEFDPIISKSLHKGLYLSLFFPRAWLILHTSRANTLPDCGPSKNSLSSHLPHIASSDQLKTELVSPDTTWSGFIKSVDESDQPLLNSVLRQSSFMQFNKTSLMVHIKLDKKFEFFGDMLDRSSNVALAKSLDLFFGKGAALAVQFEFSEVAVESNKGLVKVGALQSNDAVVNRLPVQKLRQKDVIVNDQDLPLTKMLLQEIDGTVSEIIDL
jgi:DNA polymerase III subunit gamma/tau